MAGAGSGCPGEEGAGPLREAQSGCFATSGAAARPPRASPGVGTVSQISGTRGSGRAGVLVEVVASQEMTSEACAWGGEVSAQPGRRGRRDGGGRTLAEPRARGPEQGPFLGEFPAGSALPASPRLSPPPSPGRSL